MTCIVGLINEQDVYIGGDSAGASGNDVSIRKDSKVFKTGEFIFGCTSSFRMIQLIRYKFKPPVFKRQDVFEYMCTDFIDVLRKVLGEGGFKKKENEVDEGGTFLVGYKGKLFKIHSDFQVEESVNCYNACGCGENFAAGVMYAIVFDDLTPEEKINKALEAASYFSGAVRPPFNIVKT